MVNFASILHLLPLFLPVWIRIRNTDPNPQSCLIGTDPIWIRMHNTDCDLRFADDGMVVLGEV